MVEAGRRSAYEVLQVRDDAEHLVIVAAYRALAAHYHPDRNLSAGAERRLAELNWAYDAVRTADRRQVYDRTRQAASPRSPPIVTPPRAPVRAPDSDANVVLDFGRYAGWSLRDLARHDPDYLRWLSRHSAGIRHRQRIEALLRDLPKPSASERMRGRR